MPPTLLTHALAALAAQVLAGDTPPGGDLRPLADARAALGGAPWTDSLAAYLRDPAPADAPLLHLASRLPLSRIEILTVALAAAVEQDPLIGRVLASLQTPIGGSRPMLGLVAAAFADLAAPGVRPSDALFTGAALRSGLLELLGEGAPLPERPVSVPLPLCLALAGLDASWPGSTIGLGDVPEVALPPSILEEARRQAEVLRSAPRRALVLRTGSNAEGRSVAMAVARAMDRRPLFIETDRVSGLAPLLLLRGLVPVHGFDLGPGERRNLPSIPLYDGPALSLCGPDGGVATASGAALGWSLPVPPAAEREQLWQAALGDGELAASLARHHRHGSGRIAHLGRLARHQGHLRGRDRPTIEDVTAASWIGEGAGLDGLAEPLAARIPDEALVTTPPLREALETLLVRCRSRDRLIDGLGPAATARYSPGVRALFVGPSGTGKTLAAGWLATRLGLPLHRVDLASVTSKYIGETEKNLAMLLARAEQAEVVLLFDEADSLFGKRTDVKEANDRFANAQTNYLLQRIETFDGITILTSNSQARFDTAFARRLDVILEFPLPGPEERRALWQAHLGAGHRVTARQMNQLAAVVDLGGGHVRNAVLAAAVLAREAARPIDLADVIKGLAGEYRKLGRSVPAELMR